MLSPTITYILNLLSDYVNSSNNTVSDDSIDITSFAKSQRLSVILYSVTHQKSLFLMFSSAIYRDVSRNNLLRDIDASFHENGIPYFFEKGPEIAEFYHNSIDRQFGDIDIVVKKEDKERAAEAISELGFRQTSAHPNEAWGLYNENHGIELHHKLIYSSTFSEEKHTSFTDTVWEHCLTNDGIQYHIEKEFHFVFLLLHLRKHFLWEGVGIRRFLDIAIMIKTADLNWDIIREYLVETELVDFTKVCLAFIKRWFDVSCPIGCAEISDEFYESSTETIFTTGIFQRANELTPADKLHFVVTHKKITLPYVVGVLFPPYEGMIEKYPKMGRYKILLPIMWGRRLAEFAFTKKTLQNIGTSLTKNGSQKQNQILDQWGI